MSTGTTTTETVTHHLTKTRQGSFGSASRGSVLLKGFTTLKARCRSFLAPGRNNGNNVSDALPQHTTGHFPSTHARSASDPAAGSARETHRGLRLAKSVPALRSSYGPAAGRTPVSLEPSNAREHQVGPRPLCRVQLALPPFRPASNDHAAAIRELEQLASSLRCLGTDKVSRLYRARRPNLSVGESAIREAPNDTRDEVGSGCSGRMTASQYNALRRSPDGVPEDATDDYTWQSLLEDYCKWGSSEESLVNEAGPEDNHHTVRLPVLDGTAIGKPYLHQNVDIGNGPAIASPRPSSPETQRPSTSRTDSTTTRTTRRQRRRAVFICSNPDAPNSRYNSTLNLSSPSLGLEFSPTLSTGGGQAEKDEHASIDTPTTPTVTYPLAEECISHESPELTGIGLPHILNIDRLGSTPTSSAFKYRAFSGTRETMSKGYMGMNVLHTGAHDICT
ncbi:hypothetical protein C8Q74DRAFT_1214048 [Fomes fomentarius]|nr:hypothetical protein C8Q74DRAFT_1214048 [Fomes fomentarius]